LQVTQRVLNEREEEEEEIKGREMAVKMGVEIVSGLLHVPADKAGDTGAGGESESFLFLASLVSGEGEALDGLVRGLARQACGGGDQGCGDSEEAWRRRRCVRVKAAAGLLRLFAVSSHLPPIPPAAAQAAGRREGWSEEDEEEDEEEEGGRLVEMLVERWCDIVVEEIRKCCISMHGAEDEEQRAAEIAQDSIRSSSTTKCMCVGTCVAGFVLVYMCRVSCTAIYLSIFLY
jgi:hypothetical protein